MHVEERAAITLFSRYSYTFRSSRGVFFPKSLVFKNADFSLLVFKEQIMTSANWTSSIVRGPAHRKSLW